jgi:hypothetical protein
MGYMAHPRVNSPGCSAYFGYELKIDRIQISCRIFTPEKSLYSPLEALSDTVITAPINLNNTSF